MKAASIPEWLQKRISAEPPFPAAPDRIEPGQLWVTGGAEGVVLVTEKLQDGDLWMSYPLSTETAYLSASDVWLAGDETWFGRPAMVMTSLNVPVSGAALLKFLGRAGDSLLETVSRVADEDPSAIDLMRVGPPVLTSDDSRYDFQARELERWQAVTIGAYEVMAKLDEERADDTLGMA